MTKLCKRCSGPTIQGFTDVYCKAECDIKPGILGPKTYVRFDRRLVVHCPTFNLHPKTILGKTEFIWIRPHTSSWNRPDIMHSTVEEALVCTQKDGWAGWHIISYQDTEVLRHVALIFSHGCQALYTIEN